MRSSRHGKKKRRKCKSSRDTCWPGGPALQGPPFESARGGRKERLPTAVDDLLGTCGTNRSVASTPPSRRLLPPRSRLVARTKDEAVPSLGTTPHYLCSLVTSSGHSPQDADACRERIQAELGPRPGASALGPPGISFHLPERNSRTTHGKDERCTVSCFPIAFFAPTTCSPGTSIHRHTALLCTVHKQARPLAF